MIENIAKSGRPWPKVVVSSIRDHAVAPMAGKKKNREGEDNELVDKIVEMLRREVDETLGPDATYEQRRDLEAELMRKALWRREDEDLKDSATDAAESRVPSSESLSTWT